MKVTGRQNGPQRVGFDFAVKKEHSVVNRTIEIQCSVGPCRGMRVRIQYPAPRQSLSDGGRVAMRIPYLCCVVGKSRRLARRVRGHGRWCREHRSVFMYHALAVNSQGHGMRPRRVTALVESLM